MNGVSDDSMVSNIKRKGEIGLGEIIARPDEHQR